VQYLPAKKAPEIRDYLLKKVAERKNKMLVRNNSTHRFLLV
jgi:hypothetical protein